MISMLCLETSCSEGAWPKDSRGVGWVPKSSSTMAVGAVMELADGREQEYV